MTRFPIILGFAALSLAMAACAEEPTSGPTGQGCTTFVTGNCGFSPGGFRRNSEYKGMIRLGADRGFDVSWDTMEGYFEFLGRAGLSHNIVHLAGHGTTQISMRGMDPSPLDESELKELLALLEEAMDQGARGVSFGLGWILRPF